MIDARQAGEILTIGAVIAVGFDPADTEPLIKSLRSNIVPVHGQPQIDAAPRHRPGGDMAQKHFADPVAAKGFIDIEVLHVDAGLAIPCREDGEKQGQPGKCPVHLGDQAGECRIGAETVTAKILDRAGNPVGSAKPLAHDADRLMDHFGISGFAQTNDDAPFAVQHDFRHQNATLSPPLRPRYSRASSGVATSSDRPSRMPRMRRT